MWRATSAVSGGDAGNRPDLAHAARSTQCDRFAAGVSAKVVVADCARWASRSRRITVGTFRLRSAWRFRHVARRNGLQIPAEDATKPYVEVSGRKGHGVKADDLLDRLEAAAQGSGSAPYEDSGCRTPEHRTHHCDRRAALFPAAVHTHRR